MTEDERSLGAICRPVPGSRYFAASPLEFGFHRFLSITAKWPALESNVTRQSSSHYTQARSDGARGSVLA